MTDKTPAQIDHIVDQDREELLAVIAESVAIPSVRAEALPGKPFGEQIHQALEHALDVGTRLGFRVERLDGYAGWIEFGQGDDLIGVLSHIDVVPVGKLSDWSHPPFSAETVDGRMYGRGVADDKGPLFSTLYGLKAVRDAGLPLSKRIRLLIGTDEESGWGGIKRYLETEEIPTCGFSPDGMFTVVNREKGSSVIRLVGADTRRASHGLRLSSLRGGTAPNNVPDEAVALLKGAASCISQIQTAIDSTIGRRSDASLSLQVEPDGDSVLITSKGRSAHAMCPEKGINAIAELLRLLSILELVKDGATQFASLLDQRIGFDTTGNSLEMAWSDVMSGDLTLNLGQITVDDRQAIATMDIRSPVSVSCASVLTRVVSAFADTDGAIGVEVQKQSEPLHVPDEHPLITTLSKVYNEVTGHEPILHAIGGGTYARAIDNCVCFGAVYPGEEITVHQPNECALIENIILNGKVYGHALYELAK